MLFNSHIFLFVFLPVTWILFRVASQIKLFRIAIAGLSIASLIFYSYWNPPFVLLIVFSIWFNFCWGYLLHSSVQKQRWVLSIGVAVNLGLIAYFKYAGFFLDNLNSLFDLKFDNPGIFLPLGISFFTFQQIAYLIDCHRGLTKEHNFWQYCLFVTYFPQLIAGPIVHHSEMMPQFADKKTFRLNARNLSLGFALLSLGLFKKVIIADTLSRWVAEVFDQASSPDFVAAWMGTLSYTFQIYFDFSGYSEMALGLGYLFNIELPINFDSPYKSVSVIEFWKRWHITLSRFFKDYLYIPLGGNRKGTPRRYANLMITMLLGGLWHGAAWAFVLWGGLHGLYLSIGHLWRKISARVGFAVPRPLAWLMTFVAVAVAWVFFRAPSFEKAFDIVQGMFGGHGVDDLVAVLLCPFG